MAGIINSKEVKLIYCGLKVLVITDDSEHILDIPPPAPAPASANNTKNGVNGDQVSGVGPGHGHDNSVSISCAGVSPAGDMIAVCDDFKQVSIFKLPEFRWKRNESMIL